MFMGNWEGRAVFLLTRASFPTHRMATCHACGIVTRDCYTTIAPPSLTKGMLVATVNPAHDSAGAKERLNFRPRGSVCAVHPPIYG